MNRDQLQDRIRRHIATAVAAITTDVAEYTAGQVKAAVVPPAVVQRGEPPQQLWHLWAGLANQAACGYRNQAGGLITNDPCGVTCEACILAFATAAGTGAAPASHTRNTITPPHTNTGR